MRALKRNEVGFYYAEFVGFTDVVDDDGNKTGEKKKTYSDPIFAKANISPAAGYSYLRVFGKSTDYSRVICTCDMNCPITEESVIWIYDGLTPYNGPTEDQPFNYTVSKVAKSLNNILYAVKKKAANVKG